jgi:hypothetical protein
MRGKPASMPQKPDNRVLKNSKDDKVWSMEEAYEERILGSRVTALEATYRGELGGLAFGVRQYVHIVRRIRNKGFR